MNTSIDFLPEYKQKELYLLRDLIIKAMRPEMIILFGSYARNEWVEDKYTENGILYEYKSDFDILVISRVNLGPSRIKAWRKLEDTVGKLEITTPVSLIHEGIKDVNAEIRKHSYFFTDILKEGIMLYNTGHYELAEPGKMNEKQVREKAKQDFEHWFESAGMFYEDFENNFKKGEQKAGYFKNAAFLLHQVTERLYSAFLLVFTGYRPKTHDLKKLGEMSERINEKLKTVFPMATPDEKKRFELLRRAYIDARYKKEYEISREDLEYLSNRVEVLREVVKEVCGGKVG